MSLSEWFNSSQHIYSMVIHVIALTSSYFEVRCLVFVLSHTDEEIFTAVATVSIAGTLLSPLPRIHQLQLFSPLGLDFFAVLVHSLCGLHILASGILNSHNINYVFLRPQNTPQSDVD